LIGERPAVSTTEAVRTFLAHPDHLVFIYPHHDIGDLPDDLSHDERLQRQIADFRHHGDTTIPPQQQLGGFARSLLAGLGVPVENRFGLRPAAEADGSPFADRGRGRARPTSPFEGRSAHSICTRICRSSSALGQQSPEDRYGSTAASIHARPGHLRRVSRSSASADRTSATSRRRIESRLRRWRSSTMC
jgi:hypothetical protein